MRLIILALLLPVFAAAQSKGDTKITATPSDTAHLFSKLVTLLYTEDYIVKVEDSTHGVIVTEPKMLKQYLNPTLRLKLTVRANTVTITGEFNSNLKTAYGSESTYEPVINRGMKGSVYRVSWDEMDRIAKIIGATSYGK